MKFHNTHLYMNFIQNQCKPTNTILYLHCIFYSNSPFIKMIVDSTSSHIHFSIPTTKKATGFYSDGSILNNYSKTII